MRPQHVILKRVAQVDLDLAAALSACIHAGFEEAEGAARDSFLARVSAMSAFFRSLSESSPSPGAIAIPMLAPMTTE